MTGVLLYKMMQNHARNFRVTLFNNGRDNGPSAIIRRVSCTILAKQLCVVLLCHVRTCKILHAAQHCASLQYAII